MGGLMDGWVVDGLWMGFRCWVDGWVGCGWIVDGGLWMGGCGWWVDGWWVDGLVGCEWDVDGLWMSGGRGSGLFDG